VPILSFTFKYTIDFHGFEGKKVIVKIIYVYAPLSFLSNGTKPSVTTHRDLTLNFNDESEESYFSSTHVFRSLQFFFSKRRRRTTVFLEQKDKIRISGLPDPKNKKDKFGHKQFQKGQIFKNEKEPNIFQKFDKITGFKVRISFF